MGVMMQDMVRYFAGYPTHPAFQITAHPLRHGQSHERRSREVHEGQCCRAAALGSAAEAPQRKMDQKGRTRCPTVNLTRA